MADLFEFMLGKKDSKKTVKTSPEEKNNYSIFMPVGVYDGSDIDDEYVDNKSKAGYNNNTNSNKEPESRRGDFNPYGMEKLKSDEQLVELKRQISSLEDDIRALNDKITSLKNTNSAISVEKSRYEYVGTTYRSMIEKIVKIMPYYQEIEFTGVGSPEQWTDRRLVEIFVTCIENIKIDYSKKAKEIEQLKASLATKQSQSPQNAQNSQSTKHIEMPDIPDGLEEAMMATSQNSDLDELNMEIDAFNADIDIPVGDMSFGGMDTSMNAMSTEHLQKHLEKIDADSHLKIILETIGETGLSRVAELKETDKFKRTFVNSSGEFNQGTLSKKLKELNDIEVIEVEEINTGRKGGNEKIYSLSSNGIQLYKMLFSANPVESEKIDIKRQHTSLEHGYFIKTVAKELKSKGYEVFDLPEDCIRRPLVANEDGDEKLRVEADLIINKADTEYIIECEMGTTSDSDMAKKLDKLVLVTNVISFIMNNQDSLNKTSAKVDKWITKKGRDQLKGYTFRFTTLDTLKKKEVWQNKGPF